MIKRPTASTHRRLVHSLAALVGIRVFRLTERGRWSRFATARFERLGSVPGTGKNPICKELRPRVDGRESERAPATARRLAGATADWQAASQGKLSSQVL